MVPLIYRWPYHTLPTLAKIAATVLLMVVQMNTSAQRTPENQSPSSIIYEHTLHNRFKTADSLIRYYEHTSNGDMNYQLAVINFYWWKYISTDYNTDFARIIKSMVKVSKNQKLSPTDKRYLEQLFVTITSLAYNARLDLSNKSYYNAMAALAEYNTTIKESFGNENEYNSFYLTSGLYYYFHAHASEKVPFFNTFAGTDKRFKKSDGLIFLKKASLHPDMVINTEAKYFLMKIASEIENDNVTAGFYAHMLCKEFPENILFRYHKIRIHLESGQTEMAQKETTIFHNTLKNTTELSNDEKLYFRGLIAKELSKKRTNK